METFLVTGASGFLGSALIERLLTKGYKVIGIDRKENRLLNKESNNDKYKFIKADLGHNINKLVVKYQIDGVFHLASQLPTRPDLHYIDFYNGNVQTTLTVIDLVRERKIKLFVYTSTCSVFGLLPKEKYLSEESIPTPTNYYGLTKNVAEKLLAIESMDKATKIVVIRYSSIFGKYDSYGIVRNYYHMAMQGKDIEINCKGERYRNIIYIDDAVEILLKSIVKYNNLGNFELFMTGSKNSLKMIEIAQIIVNLLSSKSKIIPLSKESQTNWDIFIKQSKAKIKFDFNPISIEEGLKKYVGAMRNEI